jgi:hypothetical protein
MVTALYRWYHYDLRGNDTDGYEVNNIYPSSVTFRISDRTKDRNIIRRVKAKRTRFNDYDLDRQDCGEGVFVIYINYRGNPLGELRREETGS